VGECVGECVVASSTASQALHRIKAAQARFERAGIVRE
jgi:hypothetical protein